MVKFEIGNVFEFHRLFQHHTVNDTSASDIYVVSWNLHSYRCRYSLG